MNYKYLLSTLSLILIIGLYVPDSFSQIILGTDTLIAPVPHGSVILTNDTLSADRTQYEFDVYLLRTGTVPWELSGIQLGFQFNNLIKNGTTTLTYVAGSADSIIVKSGVVPANGNINMVVGNLCVAKIAAKIPPLGAGSGAIISSVSPGTRLARFRFTCAAQFTAGQLLSLTFNSVGVPLYTTQPSAYVANSIGGSTIVDITTNSTFINNIKSFTGIKTEGVGLPIDFSISQNYPNPFNPTTKIEYQIPIEAKVTIDIYNIKGQKVFELVNQNQSAGYYTVDFGASKLASGVYIYRMIANDKVKGTAFSSFKKMILLK